MHLINSPCLSIYQDQLCGLLIIDVQKYLLHTKSFLSDLIFSDELQKNR